MGLKRRQRKRRNPGKPWGSLSWGGYTARFGGDHPPPSPGGSGGIPQYLVALLGDPVLAVTVAVIAEGSQGTSPQEVSGGHVTTPTLTLWLWGQQGVTSPRSHPVPAPQERSWGVTHLLLLQQPPKDELVQDVEAVAVSRLAGLGTQEKG